MKRKKDIRGKYMGSVIVVSLIGIFVIGIIFFRIYSLYEINQDLAAQEKLLDDQIQSEKIKSVELTNKMDYLETDEFVEEIARDKFGLIKEGEKIIKSKEE